MKWRAKLSTSWLDITIVEAFLLERRRQADSSPAPVPAIDTVRIMPPNTSHSGGSILVGIARPGQPPAADQTAD